MNLMKIIYLVNKYSTLVDSPLAIHCTSLRNITARIPYSFPKDSTFGKHIKQRCTFSIASSRTLDR